MTDLTEILKATLITEDNFETINILGQSNGLAPAAMKVGRWFVSQTIRAKAIFPDLGEFLEQRFYAVTEDYMRESLNLIGEPTGFINACDAERKTNTTNTPNTEVKDTLMSHCPMTVEYALFMIDRYGSRTHDVLMEYGRTSEEILATFEKAVKEGYLGETDAPKKPYLTDDGRRHLRDYYGNDQNGHGER